VIRNSLPESPQRLGFREARTMLRGSMISGLWLRFCATLQLPRWVSPICHGLEEVSLKHRLGETSGVEP
jgi:hypothetical protein